MPATTTIATTTQTYAHRYTLHYRSNTAQANRTYNTLKRIKPTDDTTKTKIAEHFFTVII